MDGIKFGQLFDIFQEVPPSARPTSLIAAFAPKVAKVATLLTESAPYFFVKYATTCSRARSAKVNIRYRVDQYVRDLKTVQTDNRDPSD